VKRGRKKSPGNSAIEWIEKYCIIPEGPDVGKPLKLRPWQKAELKKIYDNKAGTRRAIISFGRKNAKALALDTPIPTPVGWRTVGEVHPGEFVFGSDGRPVEVLAVSEVFEDKRCYAVGFSDGSSIVASEDHLWTTRHRYRPWENPRRNGSGNGGRPRKETITTAQIATSVMAGRADAGVEFNHKLAVAPPLHGNPVELPVPPYVLGAWLGDGTSTCSNITVGARDAHDMALALEGEAVGNVQLRHYPSSRALTICITGERPADSVQARLRMLGLLSDKHIPEIYLGAGLAQRWALLQGLMDTDGTVTLCAGRTTPRCSFANSNYRLAHDVWRLCRSLGLKATITSGEAKIYGRKIGACWRVTFAASAATQIFRLERKQRLLPRSLAKRSSTLAITSCVKVESVPTKCLMVAAADNLFLAGYGCVPTHNTTLAACLLLLHLCGPKSRPNSQLYSAAQSRDQAAIIFGLAAKIVRMSPELRKNVVIRDTAKQLFCPGRGTLYRALSAEAATAYGLSPVFIVHDELGQVRGPRSELFEALETATGAQDDPISVIISTQAPTDADLLSVLIDDAVAGHDPRVVVSLYTAPLDADPFDEKTIRKANPALGDFLNEVEVFAMAADAKRMPSREAEFRNLILNQRIHAESPFVTRAVWQSCGDPPDSLRHVPIYAGLDLSEVSDLTALVLIGQVDGKWHVRPTFWLPGDELATKARIDRVPYDQWAKEGWLIAAPGKSIDYEYVAAHLRDVLEEYDVRKIAFDRWNMKHLKPWLVKAGIDDKTLADVFVEFGQGYQSMSPALRSLEAELLNGRMAHGNHPVLGMCAANAIVQTDPAGGRKFNKAKRSGRIDGMVALAMAMGVASGTEHVRAPEYQVLIL
jgi:phage terminase large subunit-like protein